MSVMGALLGLGSTYRVLGRFDLSLATLRRGLEEFVHDFRKIARPGPGRTVRASS
jgi:hypothetical protein